MDSTFECRHQYQMTRLFIPEIIFLVAYLNELRLRVCMPSIATTDSKVLVLSEIKFLRFRHARIIHHFYLHLVVLPVCC